MIHGIKETFDNRCEKGGEWLKANPTVYKVVLIVSHLFRAMMVLVMIDAIPFSMPIATGLILVPSLIYRIAVERFCIFRFTLPSWVGGVSMWMARSYPPLGVVTLAGYLVTIIYISHQDVEELLRLGGRKCH